MSNLLSAFSVMVDFIPVLPNINQYSANNFIQADVLDVSLLVLTNPNGYLTNSNQN